MLLAGKACEWLTASEKDKIVHGGIIVWGYSKEKESLKKKI